MIQKQNNKQNKICLYLYKQKQIHNNKNNNFVILPNVLIKIFTMDI